MARWTGKHAPRKTRSTSVQYLKSKRVERSCLKVAAGGRASSACTDRSFRAANASYSSRSAATSRPLQSLTASRITRPWSHAFDDRRLLINFFRNVANPVNLRFFLSLKISLVKISALKVLVFFRVNVYQSTNLTGAIANWSVVLEGEGLSVRPGGGDEAPAPIVFAVIRASQHPTATHGNRAPTTFIPLYQLLQQKFTFVAENNSFRSRHNWWRRPGQTGINLDIGRLI